MNDLEIKNLNKNIEVNSENVDLVIDELLERNEMVETSKVGCKINTCVGD